MNNRDLPPELDVLTRKERMFVLLLDAGRPQRHAFKEAGYKAEGDFDTKASALTKKPQVCQALAALASRALARHEGALDRLLRQLNEVREACLAAEPIQGTAAVNALMGQARLLGLITDKQVLEIQHKPALSGSKVLELDEVEWRRQFTPRLPGAEPGADDSILPDDAGRPTISDG